MKHYTQYISFLSAVLVLLLSACSRDRAEEGGAGPYEGERIPMGIQFKTGDAVTDDSTIKSARILVFNDNNQLVYNDISAAEFQSAGIYVAQAEAARGRNNFYVICNEPASLTAKLNAVTDQTTIEELGFNAVGVALPMPMYGKVLRAYVSAKSDGSDAKVVIDNVVTDYLPVKVTRMLAKLSFTAIKNVATPEEDFVVEELRIRVCRMPMFTTLAEGRVYADTNWSSDLTALGEGTLNNNGSYTVTGNVYTIPDGVDRVTVPDLYIPEHLLAVAADRSKATYLTVDATCKMKNGSTQMLHSTYQVNIGKNPPADHNLTRNNHYNIYATITAIGAMGLFAEIQAMDEFNIAINWKPVDGLVIVSDKISDYDLVADSCKNVNVWSDYSVYSGILKTYHSDKGYNDISFKYGSLIAVRNNLKATTALPFVPPVSAANLEDILWYPSIYGNPYTKITNWGGIPYVLNGDIPVDNSQVTQGLGDPCKLVGLSPEQILNEGIVDNKQWHMATPEEYAILQQAANNEANVHGYKSFHYIMAPNVKTRATDGELSATKNGGGYYWTTTRLSAFGFVSATPAGAGVNVQDPQNGYAVRCVRNVISETKLSVLGNPHFSYRGNITSGSAFSVTSNIPFWTATLIEDPTDPEVGNSRDFADFSFAPGGTNVKTVSGGFNNGAVSVYLPRRESQTSRTFRIRVRGMGFNGQTETVYMTVTQEAYSINVVPTFNPLADDKEHWIPAAGGEYILTIHVTPTDIAVPAGYLIVVASYLGKEIARTEPIPSVANQYQYSGIPITIPENKTPDPIGLIFNAALVDTPTSYVPPTEVDAYCLQDKY